MPDTPPPPPDARPEAERLREHRAVERLAATLLPALIAKLSATGLAELEIREGEWKVRLRRPLEVVGGGRRASDRQFRLPVPGAGQHPGAHPPGHPAAPTRGAATPPGTAATGREPRPASDPAAPVVTSPAVGIFRPRPGIAGTRVEAGDRIGAVDMLGIAQEVVAPIDGVVGALLAEAGDGVEYGQPLVEMERVPIGDRVIPSPAERSTDGAAPPGPGVSAVVAGERP